MTLLLLLLVLLPAPATPAPPATPATTGSTGSTASTAFAPAATAPSRTPLPARTPSPAGTAGRPSVSAPTFCAEWVRQSREGYERLTLFSDRSLVWKRSRDGVDDVQRKQIPAEELTFYCDYFARPEVWALDENLTTGLIGEFAPLSLVTLTRPDGSRKRIRFDEFSPLPAEAAGVRAAFEGLRGVLTSPLAPASRFAPGLLEPGQILKRFDGAMFRIRSIEPDKGVVELEGVSEPYRFFRKIDELRFQFSPPE